MAATEAIIHLLNPGDEVICTHDLYGGTYRLFTKVYAKYGIVFHFVDMAETVNWFGKINSKTRMVWVETPTNPTLKIIDIQAVSKAVKTYSDQHDHHEILLTVDNTFASPYLQNPLDLGANIVQHSVTKYIAGHSDVVMGAAIVKDPEIARQLAFFQNSCGAVPGPQDCFLVLRGIKTLAVRMQRHGENGGKIAHFLRSHPKIDKVFWPGFSDHSHHEVAKRQMRGFGGMISFTLKGDAYNEAMKFAGSMHIFSLAESLGGVESLIGHPASMTHASIPREERMKAGLTDSLLRISVGIEDIDDLIEDLSQALEKVAI
jgi:cystathionine beta-lyase